MEVFMFVSGIGTLILLTTHMIDYALEVMRRPLEALQGAVRNEEAEIGDGPVPRDIGEQYDRAA